MSVYSVFILTVLSPSLSSNKSDLYVVISVATPVCGVIVRLFPFAVAVTVIGGANSKSLFFKSNSTKFFSIEPSTITLYAYVVSL